MYIIINLEQLTSNAFGIRGLTASVATVSLESSSTLAFAAVNEREAALERESEGCNIYSAVKQNVYLDQQMSNEYRRILLYFFQTYALLFLFMLTIH